MGITPSTRPIGLIGCPISHSLSPKLHNAIYQKYGIDCVYLAFSAEKERLEDVINGFKALSFVGFNVTVPHKQNALPYLDDLDKEAAIIGAVNTVKIENGRLVGYNTDGWGFIGSIKNRGYDIRGMDVLVLGAGGSARAISVYLAKEGANTINILNRTESNAVTLAEHIKRHYPSATINGIGKHDLHIFRPNIIINTTSVGMWPQITDSPLGGYNFFSDQIVVDIIYNPLQTKLLKDACDVGCTVINGLDMLVGQAVKAIEIWTGIEVSHNYGLHILSKV
jgi:shikimate dehydrogenase